VRDRIFCGIWTHPCFLLKISLSKLYNFVDILWMLLCDRLRAIPLICCTFKHIRADSWHNHVHDSHRLRFIQGTICMFKGHYSYLAFLRYTFLIIAMTGTAFLVTGCDMGRNLMKPDREANLEIQDYRDAFAPRPVPEEEAESASSTAIPDLQPYVASARGRMKPMPLVSISVNQSVPLRDVLFELAKQADYDLEMDPNIRGSIIFTARERPFDRVIERISKMAGLRYSFDDDSLRIEVDTPYNKTYKIDYLNYIRNNKGSIRNDIAVVSGDGADTGSSFEVESESSNDFWGELEAALQQIVGARPRDLRTKNDPRITAVDQNPDVQPVAPDGSGNVSAPQAVLQVNSMPIDDDNRNVSGSTNQDDEDVNTYNINKQAGIVNLYANERTHKEVQAYFNLLRRSVTSQVLIEAKILEVTLNDQFNAGIDWQFLDPRNGRSIIQYGQGNIWNQATNALDAVQTGTGSNLVLGHLGSDAGALIKALSTFGTVRALASPRMTVLNNQSAVLNVATNQVYFEIDIDTQNSAETGRTADVSSEIRNVPEGILVNVQPSINLDDRTVSLAVRPTITRVVSSEANPAVAFAVATLGDDAGNAADLESLIPELNVQEIDTVIKVRSGEAAVMGGLLQDRVTTDETGVPGLSEIPLLGGAFRQHSDSIEKTELVIFLKATILDNPGDSINNADRDLYRKFSHDRRPLKL